MADHGREAAGTVAAALIWLVGMFAFFMGLGFGTHLVVDMTVKSGSGAWRAAVGAIAAMFLLAAIFALVLIGGRGVAVVPRRIRRRRRAKRAAQQAGT